MSNQLRELGEFVVFENPQLHEIQEIGVMVPHQAPTNAQLTELGVMVLHDARAPVPQSNLIEIGVMILHSAPAALNNQKLQSYQISNFIGRQGSALKRTSGNIPS